MKQDHCGKEEKNESEETGSVVGCAWECNWTRIRKSNSQFFKPVPASRANLGKGVRQAIEEKRE